MTFTVPLTAGLLGLWAYALLTQRVLCSGVPRCIHIVLMVSQTLLLICAGLAAVVGLLELNLSHDPYDSAVALLSSLFGLLLVSQIRRRLGGQQP